MNHRKWKKKKLWGFFTNQMTTQITLFCEIIIQNCAQIQALTLMLGEEGTTIPLRKWQNNNNETTKKKTKKMFWELFTNHLKPQIYSFLLVYRKNNTQIQALILVLDEKGTGILSRKRKNNNGITKIKSKKKKLGILYEPYESWNVQIVQFKQVFLYKKICMIFDE